MKKSFVLPDLDSNNDNEIYWRLVRWTAFIFAIFLPTYLLMAVAKTAPALPSNLDQAMTYDFFIKFFQSDIFLFVLFGVMIAYTIFVYRLLIELFLFIVFITDLFKLLKNRQAHLKGRKK